MTVGSQQEMGQVVSTGWRDKAFRPQEVIAYATASGFRHKSALIDAM